MSQSPMLALGTWMLCSVCLMVTRLDAALPTNSSFEAGSVKPWVLKTEHAEVRISEEVAHEGTRSLKVTPASAEAKPYGVELWQLVPWTPKQAMMPQAWVRGGGIESAKLVLTSFDESFSQMEEWTLSEVTGSETWSPLKAAEPIALPDFTAHLRIKLTIRAQGLEPVYVDQVELGKQIPPTSKDPSTGFSGLLHQQVDLLKKAVKSESPSVLLLGDSSMLGWNRYASRLTNELNRESPVMAWGFLGDSSTEQILKMLKQDEFRPQKQSTVVLSFGYHDLLHSKLSGKASAEQVLALRRWLLEVDPSLRIEVFALLDQHVDVPTSWRNEVVAFNQTLNASGLELVTLKTDPNMDRSKGAYLEANYLPNAEAREALIQALRERLKPKLRADKKDE